MGGAVKMYFYGPAKSDALRMGPWNLRTQQVYLTQPHTGLMLFTCSRVTASALETLMAPWADQRRCSTQLGCLSRMLGVPPRTDSLGLSDRWPS